MTCLVKEIKNIYYFLEQKYKNAITLLATHVEKFLSLLKMEILKNIKF